MKLWIVSDLHQDCRRFEIEPPPDADVAILAGDIQNDDLIVEIGQRLPTIFVAGNHSFYGHQYHERLDRLHELTLRSPYLHVLENEEVCIGGIRFLGCTLWTDYCRGHPSAMNAARMQMNDHRKIKWQKDPWLRFRPEEALMLHNTSVNWLYDRFHEHHDGPTVVVTHHAPSERSVAPKYEGQILNHAFYTDLEEQIDIWAPSLWIHGHVHSNFNYMIGETRIVCNPHGYSHENAEFNPEFMVDI